MIQNIERAAFSAGPEDIRQKLARAPQWVRSRVAATHATPHAPRSTPTTRGRAPVVGWAFGVCCPNVSRPCHCTADGETLPEQITPRCMAEILQQVRNVSGDGIPLTLDHGGPVLARSGDLDVTFDVERWYGLTFTARLRSSKVVKKLLDSVGADGYGVSIGFTKPRTWIVERNGIGRLRVVDSARLDHISLIDPSQRNAAYSGARCFIERSTGIGCSTSLRDRATAWAWRAIKADALAMTR
jgi:hypothetical protein